MKSRKLMMERLEERQVLSGVTGVCTAPTLPPSPAPAALVATPLVLNTRGETTVQRSAAVVAPTITAIGGMTNDNTGISNGKINETWGQTYNGLRVVNDTPGYYPWTVSGTNFGATKGTVTLNGRSVSIVQWTNTSITVDASGAQFNPQQPWNWGPMCTTLVVKTASGQQVTQGVNVAPAISTLIYGQCTFGAAYQRKLMGLAPVLSPYANATSIDVNWVPQRGDQLVWSVPSLGCKHTAVITNVSKTVSGNQTVYNLTIYQWNADNHNSVSTFNTMFAITRQSNGQLKVSAFPKCYCNGPDAYGYDR